ncbi:vasotab-like [Schistocerca cancellata]|uniref:vasotab-like n=1 Tax=Schistocerca cancellata TaxID=274614 RepID=UPI002118AD10|nr:vasotab-like [Schistocerca cancellata]
MNTGALIIILAMAGASFANLVLPPHLHKPLAPICCPRFVPPECCPSYCPEEYKPVCATDCHHLRTFANICFMHATNCLENTRYRKVYDGKCPNSHPMLQFHDKEIEWM